MRWITRARPKTDRIACPWLIRKFIDSDAEIIYAPTEAVLSEAERLGAHSFDAPNAEFTHRDGRCTFEVLIDEFNLSADNPALLRLAQIVHSADISSDIDNDPLAHGLRAIGEGGLLCEKDDYRLLERGSFVYDALYEWCRKQTR